MSMEINRQQPQPGPSVLGSTVKTCGKLVLSGVYCAGGVAMMALGTCASFYSLQKVVHFYSSSEPGAEPSSGLWAGLGATSAASDYRGYGPIFESGCNFMTDKLDFTATGQAICNNLAMKPWSELSGVDMKTAALGVTIVGELTIIYASAFLVMSGASLFSRGLSLMSDTLL